MMTDVFISYAYPDAKFAKQLATGISRDGLTVTTFDEFEPGQNLAVAITDAIEKSKNIIIVLSDDSFQSDWVKAETALAMSQHGKRIIPIFRKKNIEIPFLLRNLLGLSFSDDENYDEQLNKLTETLKKPQDIFDIEEQTNRVRLRVAAEISHYLDIEREKLHRDFVTKNTTLTLSFTLIVTSIIFILSMVGFFFQWDAIFPTIWSFFISVSLVLIGFLSGLIVRKYKKIIEEDSNNAKTKVDKIGRSEN